MDLTQMKCESCQVGAPPATAEELEIFLIEHKKWKLIQANETNMLQAYFEFKTYQDCLDFAIKVGELADVENHHPDILIQWGKITVTWWTHKIQDIHQNDLIMAAKTEVLAN